MRDEFVSSAFRKSGYKPFDLDLILHNLSDLALKKDLESQEKSGEASFNGPLSSDLIPVHSFLQNSQRFKDCPRTPGNPAQVDHLLELATKKDMMDPVAFKLAKRLKKKIAECAIRKKENADIVVGLREKKKRARKGGDIGEGRLLNVAYLQDQDAVYTKQLAEKEELQKKKKEAKKDREFQAECRSLWKITALFVSTRSRQLAPSQTHKPKPRPEVIPEDSCSSSEESNTTSESESDSWMFAPPSSSIPPKPCPLRGFPTHPLFYIQTKRVIDVCFWAAIRPFFYTAFGVAFYHVYLSGISTSARCFRFVWYYYS